MMLFQIASYFNIRMPKRLNYFSLEQIGLKIEQTAIRSLQKSDESFNGKTLEEMIGFIFQKIYSEFAKQFEHKNEEEKEEIVKHILLAVKDMPKEQQERFKAELNTDELSAEVIKKAIAAGTFGTAFAATVSIAGFSAYTFATSSLASLAGLFGISLPFGAFSGITSIIAVLSNPLFLLGSMGGLLYFLNSKSNESIKIKLSPMIISLISILSINAENYLCKIEKHLSFYNLLIDEYQEANDEQKKEIEERVKGFKDVTFEKRSVFDLSIVPSSKVATCDKSLELLNQPVFQDSLSKRFENILGKSYSSFSKETDIFTTSITIGDLIYDMSRVDPLVLEAIDFARKDDLADISSFAYFSKKIDINSLGDINQLKGYVAERLIAQELQSQGYEVEFPELSNQAGYDLLVNGKPFQVKCGDSPSLVQEHFEKYPDIPLFVNEELGAYFTDNDKVFSIPGIRNDEITELTKDNIESGSEILDYEIPLITLAVISGKNIFLVLQNKTDIENAIGKTIEESATRIVGGVIGSELLALGGMIWMPAAAVVGGVVGSVLGPITVNKLVNNLKLTTFLKKESDAINTAIVNMMKKSIDIAEKNLEVADKKYNQIMDILQLKNEQNIKKYISYRYDQERKYRNEKIELMKMVEVLNDAKILDEETSNILIAAQNSVILTEQAGIHPYNIQSEILELLRAVEQFNKAMSSSEITRMIKEYFVESDYAKSAKEAMDNVKDMLTGLFK